MTALWLFVIHDCIRRHILGLPRWLSGKESTCQCRRYRRSRFDSCQEDPLEEETATHSSVLPRKSHGQRSLVGYSP